MSFNTTQVGSKPDLFADYFNWKESVLGRFSEFNSLISNIIPELHKMRPPSNPYVIESVSNKIHDFYIIKTQLDKLNDFLSICRH